MSFLEITHDELNERLARINDFIDLTFPEIALGKLVIIEDEDGVFLSGTNYEQESIPYVLESFQKKDENCASLGETQNENDK